MPETTISRVRLIVRVPDLSPEDAEIVARDVRRTLENCGKLKLLTAFVETRIVEFKAAHRVGVD